MGGVDGVFTAGHFNEIRPVLIYEKGKAPLSFSRTGFPHFYASVLSVSPHKKRS